MKTSVIASLSIMILLSGCASRMPESHYERLTYMDGVVYKCAEQGKLPPQMVAHLNNAINYTLGTWKVDFDKYNNMSETVYQRTPTTNTVCNRAAIEAYDLISATYQHRQNRKATQAAMAELNESLESFNRSMNSYNQNNRPNTNQGTWGMQPQQNENIHCYETSRGDLICR